LGPPFFPLWGPGRKGAGPFGGGGKKKKKNKNFPPIFPQNKPKTQKTEDKKKKGKKRKKKKKRKEGMGGIPQKSLAPPCFRGKSQFLGDVKIVPSTGLTTPL